MSGSLSSLKTGPKCHVAICGAGIAGLVLAITVGKYNPSITIDLYEAHNSIDTLGVGIAIWEQTQEIMMELGLLDDLKQIFTKSAVPGFHIRRSDIRDGGYDWFRRVGRGNGVTSMHRQHMIAVLEKHLPVTCTVHLEKRLVNYVEQQGQLEPVILEFVDGATATCDVLVGADGIRSAVRKIMFESASKDDGNDKTDLKRYVDATFSGISLYRGVISAEALKQEDPEHLSLHATTAYIGKGKYFVTYPIAKGTLINVVAHVYNPSLVGTHYEGRWVSDATNDELIQHYDNFEPRVRTVVKLLEKPSKWALHVVKDLPFCFRKNVVLIGDACHAMSPHFGAGAGQAIEDAFVLGRLLTHPLTSLSRIPDVLRIYEEVRLSFAQRLATLSLSTAWMYPFMAPGYYDGTRKEEDLDERGISAYEREGMEVLRQEMEKRFDHVGEQSGGLEHWKDAEAKLEALADQLPN